MANQWDPDYEYHQGMQDGREEIVEEIKPYIEALEQIIMFHGSLLYGSRDAASDHILDLRKKTGYTQHMEGL